MTLLALYQKYVQYMNVKKPTQSQAKHSNLLAKEGFGYKQTVVKQFTKPTYYSQRTNKPFGVQEV